MARRTLTAKQDEVRKLLGAGQSTEQIAELMETTPGAIKAQISRMRRAGVKLDKPARTAAAVATDPRTAVPRDESPAVVQSVEDHLATELGRVSDRLANIGETLDALTAEQTTLRERQQRLEQARSALEQTTLAAVA